MTTKHFYQQELRKIINQVITSYQPEKIILFGGIAKGEYKPYSDIDLLIVKRTKEKYLDRLKTVAKILDTSLPTDIFIYTPEELNQAINQNRFFIVDEVLKKGKVVYEKAQISS